MSWFPFGDLETPKNKKGVWLRANRVSNTKLIDYLRKMGRLKFNERIWKIEVVKVFPDEKEVSLEVWANQLTLDKVINAVVGNKQEFPERNIVFYLRLKEDPDWICEGDIGKGYTTPKKS